jgi:hypothetical protein
LSTVCKPQGFGVSDGSNLAEHSIHLSFMEGEPTAANDAPLERGVGQLFFLTDEVFVVLLATGYFIRHLGSGPQRRICRLHD